MSECVLGIDFALSKSKNLPVAFLSSYNTSYKILELAKFPPLGPGIKAVFYPEIAENYFNELKLWFQEIQNTVKIKCIALDCPTLFCPENLTIRPSEKCISEMNFGIFKTPKKSILDQKIRNAQTILNETEAKPHSGFSIWMGFAIEFARVCFEFAPIIEVFPNWFWKQNIGLNYKSQPNVIQSKFKLLEEKGIVNPYEILEIGFGSETDKIDSLYCALCAIKFIENNNIVSVGVGNDLIYCVK